jgi:hypothetical protein
MSRRGPAVARRPSDLGSGRGSRLWRQTYIPTYCIRYQPELMGYRSFRPLARPTVADSFSHGGFFSRGLTGGQFQTGSNGETNSPNIYLFRRGSPFLPKLRDSSHGWARPAPRADFSPTPWAKLFSTLERPPFKPYGGVAKAQERPLPRGTIFPRNLITKSR